MGTGENRKRASRAQNLWVDCIAVEVVASGVLQDHAIIVVKWDILSGSVCSYKELIRRIMGTQVVEVVAEGTPVVVDDLGLVVGRVVRQGGHISQ